MHFGTQVRTLVSGIKRCQWMPPAESLFPGLPISGNTEIWHVIKCSLPVVGLIGQVPCELCRNSRVWKCVLRATEYMARIVDSSSLKELCGDLLVWCNKLGSSGLNTDTILNKDMNSKSVGLLRTAVGSAMSWPSCVSRITETFRT